MIVHRQSLALLVRYSVPCNSKGKGSTGRKELSKEKADPPVVCTQEATVAAKPSGVSPDNYYDREFKWTQQIRDTIQQVFGLPGFRPNQEAIINATLDRRDCLAVLPTGAGKSLCFQVCF